MNQLTFLGVLDLATGDCDGLIADGDGNSAKDFSKTSTLVVKFANDTGVNRLSNFGSMHGRIASKVIIHFKFYNFLL